LLLVVNKNDVSLSTLNPRLLSMTLIDRRMQWSEIIDYYKRCLWIFIYRVASACRRPFWLFVVMFVYVCYCVETCLFINLLVAGKEVNLVGIICILRFSDSCASFSACWAWYSLPRVPSVTLMLCLAIEHLLDYGFVFHLSQSANLNFIYF